jgi:hypothetical protein
MWHHVSPLLFEKIAPPPRYIDRQGSHLPTTCGAELGIVLELELAITDQQPGIRTKKQKQMHASGQESNLPENLG